MVYLLLIISATNLNIMRPVFASGCCKRSKCKSRRFANFCASSNVVMLMDWFGEISVIFCCCRFAFCSSDFVLVVVACVRYRWNVKLGICCGCIVEASISFGYFGIWSASERSASKLRIIVKRCCCISVLYFVPVQFISQILLFNAAELSIYGKAKLYRIWAEIVYWMYSFY